MKQILVKINNEEEFENIQNKVFDNGGVWFSGEAKVFEFCDFNEDIYALSIDIDEQGFVEDLNITYVEKWKSI